MLHLVKSRNTNNVRPKNISKRNQKLSSAIALTNQKPPITLFQKDQQKFKMISLLTDV